MIRAPVKWRARGLNVVAGLVNRYGHSAQEVMKRVRESAIGTVVTARGDRWAVLVDASATEVEQNAVPDDKLGELQLARERIRQRRDDSPTRYCALVLQRSPTASASPSAVASRRGLTTATWRFHVDRLRLRAGRSLYAFSRQIAGSYSRAYTTINGSKGRAVIGNLESIASIVVDGKETKIPRGDVSGYVVEHKVLIDAIRSGGETYVNNTGYMTNSTGAAILARMAAYSGQYVTWDEMLASVGDKPSEYSWDGVPPTLPDERGRYKIAIPGAESSWGYLD